MKLRRYLLRLLPALLLVGAWRVYRGRARERVPGIEGLDDPAVAAAFNRVAGWPQMRLLRRYVTRRALALAREGAGADAGCGPGHLVLALAREAPGLHVTGVDLSAEMLAEAEAQAARAGLAERVAFKQGDAASLPFPDGSLDLVVSSLSLHHWRDPVTVLDEIARVLRPGGAHLVFDLRRDLVALSYVLLWVVTHLVVPRALRRANEPLASRDAAYTPREAALLAARSRLVDWQIVTGPLWLAIEGRTVMPGTGHP